LLSIRPPPTQGPIFPLGSQYRVIAVSTSFVLHLHLKIKSLFRLKHRFLSSVSRKNNEFQTRTSRKKITPKCPDTSAPVSSGHFGNGTEVFRYRSVLGPKCPVTERNLHVSQLNSTQRASMDAGDKTPQCPHLSSHYFISIL